MRVASESDTRIGLFRFFFSTIPQLSKCIHVITQTNALLFPKHTERALRSFLAWIATKTLEMLVIRSRCHEASMSCAASPRRLVAAFIDFHTTRGVRNGRRLRLASRIPSMFRPMDIVRAGAPAAQVRKSIATATATTTPTTRTAGDGRHSVAAARRRRRQQRAPGPPSPRVDADGQTARTGRLLKTRPFVRPCGRHLRFRKDFVFFCCELSLLAASTRFSVAHSAPQKRSVR